MSRVPLIEELVNLIGYTSTIDLLGVYGGKVVVMSRSIGPDHPMSLTIGHARAQVLANHFAGEAVNMPSERSGLYEKRNAAIRDMVADGLSKSSVATKFGLSRKMVDKICERYAEHPRAIGERT